MLVYPEPVVASFDILEATYSPEGNYRDAKRHGKFPEANVGSVVAELYAPWQQLPLQFIIEVTDHNIDHFRSLHVCSNSKTL